MRYLMAGVLAVAAGVCQAGESPPSPDAARDGATWAFAWMPSADEDPDEPLALRFFNRVLGNLTGCEIHPDPNYRVKQLLRESKELRRIQDEWEAFWLKHKGPATPQGDKK